MGMVGKSIKLALGYVSIRAITGFVKATTAIASDLTEVQNVVDVTFGAMAKDINDFSKISIEQFGLSELSAKKFSSTMGAMLKSSGIAGEAVRDMSIDLTKLSADMASFYNLDNEAAFQKIMSGMSGMTMPLKELGINMNIVNLEAYALAQGIKKPFRNMSQAEQTMIRYNYLLSVTKDAQGDFARNQYTWANQTKILSQQWEILKGTIGQGFINMLMPVIKGLNVLIKHIQVAAEYFKAFTALIFGSSKAGSQGGQVVETMADSLGDTEEGLEGVGAAGKKAGKDLKGSIAGFDEINTLADKASEGMEGIEDSLGGVGSVDLGTASNGEFDIDTSKLEGRFESLNKILKDLYDKWGIKDFFQGFRDGLDKINFENIKTNSVNAFNGLVEIAKTYIASLQPIFQSAGQMLGTMFKYGIAIAGNIFEPITLGFANFIENMNGPIQQWMIETSEKIANGYSNLNTVFEIIGQSWLNSIEKYKPNITKVVEDINTNITKTLMLIGTIFSDVFSIITENTKKFTTKNQGEMQKFTDSIIDIFTGALGFINNIWRDVLGSISTFWNNWGKGIVDGAMRIVTDIGGWFLYLWNDLVKPIWDVMVQWLSKIWNESLKGLVDELLGFVGRVGELIVKMWDHMKPYWEMLLTFVVPHVKNVIQLIIDAVGNFLNVVIGIIKNLMKAINGIIDFLVGVFTLDWRRAWEGIKGIFTGIVGTFEGIFKGVINGVIAIVNAFIRFWNGIQLKVPEVEIPLLGTVGGFRIGLPKIAEIPMLASGGITDVNNPFMAVVGDNRTQREVVAPLDDLMGMITSAVGTAIMQTKQFDTSSNDNGDIYLQVDGTTFARIIGPYTDKEKSRIGNSLVIQGT